jgi:hypothetical protein
MMMVKAAAARKAELDAGGIANLAGRRRSGEALGGEVARVRATSSSFFLAFFTHNNHPTHRLMIRFRLGTNNSQRPTKGFCLPAKDHLSLGEEGSSEDKSWQDVKGRSQNVSFRVSSPNRDGR